ncbi:MAG TPA: DUF222 domain-containing protein, partial [Acidimicrobiales bacterium]|nr:DUF222 domain-containing protein [Acidimicrobiales bacterium]
ARDPAGARSVDALVRIATASMACKDTDERTLPLPSVILHVEAGSESNPSGISIQGGPQVSKSLAARLACDSTVTTQVEQGGLPIDLGRRKRVVSTSLRRALLARDGGCRFPGCYRYRFIHAHHIVHWADGGSTDLDNLINLCSYHHQMLHEAGWSMARDDAGEINFFGPSGQPIHRKCARISGDLASLRQYNESIGVAINADTCIPKGAGERYSLSMAVDGLFSCEGQAASEAA